MQTEKLCSKCGLIKPATDFRVRSRRNDLHSYCTPCHNKYDVERQQSFKKRCVEYKGGQCRLCGYNRYVGALEFHHRDMRLKDFQISKRRTAGLNAEVKSELDKCDLLCANCHREVHAK